MARQILVRILAPISTNILNIRIKFENNQCVVSDIMCFIKIYTDRQIDDKLTDRQTDGNEKPLFSYSSSHETPRKHDSSHSPDVLGTWS